MHTSATQSWKILLLLLMVTVEELHIFKDFKLKASWNNVLLASSGKA